jgi:hypothetical protein
MRKLGLFSIGIATILLLIGLLFPETRSLIAAGVGRKQLGTPFTYQTLSTSSEAPLAVRLFTTAVKTDSKGKIITGINSDPVKNIVGPEPAGERGGMDRYTKVMFGAGYIDGRPDPGTRIDPDNPRNVLLRNSVAGHRLNLLSLLGRRLSRMMVRFAFPAAKVILTGESQSWIRGHVE